MFRRESLIILEAHHQLVEQEYVFTDIFLKLFAERSADTRAGSGAGS